jgi:phage antirepressor YoqD-like protein
MSSREIAELTGKDHAHVMRDIRTMLEVLKKDASSFGGIYQDAYGRDKPCFNLDRELTMTLVSGYDIPLRHRVVTRLAELEAQQQPQQLSPANFSRLQLIELAMQAEQERLESEKQRQILALEVQAMAPKVEALERIAKSEGSFCLTDAAKSLQVQPRQFTQLLQSKHWIYRRPMGSGWLAYQDRIQSGHMEHKVTTGEKSDGHEWTNTQVRVTSKGMTRLAQVLAEEAGTDRLLAAALAASKQDKSAHA